MGKTFHREEQLKILAADRSNNELTTQKLQDLYPSLRPIRQAVRETLINMKKLINFYNLTNTFTFRLSKHKMNHPSEQTPAH